MNITQQQVKGLWDAMQKQYNTTTYSKQASPEMQIISQILDVLGISDKETFITEFTTTLGRNIYTPFEIGIPDPNHDLLYQLIICAHEHQHVVQYERPYGGLDFALKYLKDTTWRTAFEAEAYRVSITLHYWISGKMPDPQPYVRMVAEAYGIEKTDQDFMSEYLRLSLPTIKAKGIPDEAAKFAIQWLQANAPEILTIKV